MLTSEHKTLVWKMKSDGDDASLLRSAVRKGFGSIPTSSAPRLRQHHSVCILSL